MLANVGTKPDRVPPAAMSFVVGFPASNPRRLLGYSLTDGDALGEVVSLPSGPPDEQEQVVGRLANGDYLSTLSVLECMTQPGGGCAPNCSTVGYTVDPATGKSEVAFVLGLRWSVVAAALSPSGQDLALVERGCTTSTVRLVDQPLGHGEPRVLAPKLPVCAEDILAWSPSGDRIAVGDARGPGVNARCGVAVAPSSGPFTTHSEARTAPEAGCSVNSAAFDAEGLLTAQQCPTGADQGRVELVQRDAAGRTVQTVPLHPYLPPAVFSEGTQLEPDAPAQTTLISETLFGTPQRTYVWTFGGGRLRLVTRAGLTAPTTSSAGFLALP